MCDTTCVCVRGIEKARTAWKVFQYIDIRIISLTSFNRLSFPVGLLNSLIFFRVLFYCFSFHGKITGAVSHFLNQKKKWWFLEFYELQYPGKTRKIYAREGGGKGSNKGSGQGFCFNFSIPIAVQHYLLTVLWFFFCTLNSSKEFTETANHLSYKLSVKKLSEVFRNNKASEGKKKETDNKVRRKYFQMRFKIKRETCELELQINKEQWKSFRKPADKDFMCFIEVSKVSASLKSGKHCLKLNSLVRWENIIT